MTTNTEIQCRAILENMRIEATLAEWCRTNGDYERMQSHATIVTDMRGEIEGLIECDRRLGL